MSMNTVVISIRQSPACAAVLNISARRGESKRIWPGTEILPDLAESVSLRRPSGSDVLAEWC